jgi:hypothetical protein
MSAIAILRHKDAIHFVTDGLSYTPEGIVTGCCSKVGVVDDLKMAIFTRGPSFGAHTAAEFFADRFASFDDFVEVAPEAIRIFYETYEAEMRASSHPDMEFYFFGWSAKRTKPEAYRVRCGYSDSIMYSDKEDSSGGRYVDKPFTLLTLPDLGLAPGLQPWQLKAARFASHLKTEQMVPDVDLLHLIEIMRRTPTARFPDQPKSITVGGHAELTTVDDRGVSHRILAEYDYAIGEPLAAAAPLDWKRWRGKAALNYRLASKHDLSAAA